MPRLGADHTAAGEALWRFSLALYARPGVAAALIALQDRASLDVNLILFGLWFGACRGRRLTAGELARAASAIAPIGATAVAPLRQLRRQLKRVSDPHLQALRRRVAALEIEAERLAQSRLEAEFAAASRTPPEGDRCTAAHANLALILGDEAGSPEARLLCQALEALMRRA